MPIIEERVSLLEELMAQLIRTVDRTSREMREFKDEMREFKDEMREFKDEMREFKDEMLAFKGEMQEFKDEMREFKDEMQEFKEETRRSRKDLDKKWGELARKLGTMAEDLVAPSVPRILRQVTGCMEELDYLAVRIKKGKPKVQEFDVVAVCGEWVLINETKSTLRPEYINEFHQLMLGIRDYFPELAEKKFIGVMASLYVDETLVVRGERLGLVVLGFGEELMDVLNSQGFVPRVF